MKNKLILSISMIFLAVLSLASCKITHDHVYSDYSYDDNQHWQLCDVDGCDVKENLGNHHGGIATCTELAKCDVCGQSYGTKLEHSFTEEKVDGKYLVSAADCTNKAVYYKSCVCGEKGSETFTTGEALEHLYSSTYVIDETHHYYVCTREGCDAISEKVAHYGGVATETEKAKCDVCDAPYGELKDHVHNFVLEVVEDKYLSTSATCDNPAKYFKSCACGEKGTQTFNYGNVLSHTFSDDLSYNETHHWQNATCEHTSLQANKTAHIYGEWVNNLVENTQSSQCVCGYKLTRDLTDVWDKITISNSLVGEGTEASPYLINSAADFAYFRDNVSLFDTSIIKLTRNIDLAESNFMVETFKGTFDGNNYSIKGLEIVNTESNTGLFRVLESAGTIENLTIYGNVNGTDTVGGLVGLGKGTIDNCNNYANVTGSSKYIGGLVGKFTIGTITNSKNYGSVNGTSSVGGLVGLVGYNSDTKSTISNSTNEGLVTGSSYFVGGLFGQFESSNASNCINNGDVVSTSDSAGGLVGCIQPNAILLDSTNNGNVSGKMVGGIVYQNKGELTNCKNTGTSTMLLCTGSVNGTVNKDEGTTTNCTNEGEVVIKEHTWDNGEITQEATCTESGVKTYTCTISGCSTTYNEDYEKLGHNYESVVTDPTCTEQGYTTHSCTRCTDSYVDSYQDALNHAYSYTSNNDGTHTYTCSRDEKHSGTVECTLLWETTVEATNATAGEKTGTCSYCNYIVTEEIPALHTCDFSTEFTIDIEPTCTQEGQKSRHCLTEGCDKVTDVTVIDALGHSYENELLYHWYTCNCGEVTPNVKVTHTWKEGTVDGTSRTDTCECGLTREVDIWDGEAISTSLEGEGTEASPYLINSAADLAYFANEINDETKEVATTYSGYYFKLMVNIDLNDVENFMIGVSTTNSFDGTFDGNNYSIIGLNINRSDSRSGLFYQLLSNGTIKNLIVDGTVNGAQYTGSIVGYLDQGKIINCINLATISTSGNGVGGIAGAMNGASVIENCINHGSVTGGDSSYHVGGITGVAWTSTGSIKSCVNYGDVYCNYNSGTRGTGGIIGTSPLNSISDCTNYGKVTSIKYTGGIAGYVSSGTITNSNNYGAVTSTGERTGGIVGEMKGSDITNCINYGEISGVKYVGGITGTAGVTTIENCTNNASVTNSSSSTGGIVGCGLTDCAVVITNCVNDGDITGTSNVGGIIGTAVSGSITVNSSTNNGTVEGTNTSTVGDIVGKAITNTVIN